MINTAGLLLKGCGFSDFMFAVLYLFMAVVIVLSMLTIVNQIRETKWKSSISSKLDDILNIRESIASLENSINTVINIDRDLKKLESRVNLIEEQMNSLMEILESKNHERR